MARSSMSFLTEDQLMALGSDVRVEVIDGKVVDLPGCGVLHHTIAGNICDPISEYCRDRKWGFAFMHGLLFVLKKRDQVVINARVPDVAFLNKEQLISRTWDIEGFPRAAPVLVVEVMSSEDTANAVLRKVRDYLDAKSEQVWMVYPELREVHQYVYGNAMVHTYRRDDVIDAGEIFPGLTIALADIFALPEWE